ncbi:hypothetical protein BHE74_00031868 [Ensete ventricosum]|nr:hypothetical protein GW17_00048196 [Ensete ventricosum]RWW61091.1 hypothetical protein BHE74_00031868 [Ensete ventricosum]RZR86195.1 hypothetical protein BHM03_00013341 [Ensete ventricosum]
MAIRRLDLDYAVGRLPCKVRSSNVVSIHVGFASNGQDELSNNEDVRTSICSPCGKEHTIEKRGGRADADSGQGPAFGWDPGRRLGFDRWRRAIDSGEIWGSNGFSMDSICVSRCPCMWVVFPLTFNNCTTER